MVVDMVVWSCFFISVWMCDRKDSKSCLMDEMVEVSSGAVAGEGFDCDCAFMSKDMLRNCLISLRSSFWRSWNSFRKFVSDREMCSLMLSIWTLDVIRVVGDVMEDTFVEVMVCECLSFVDGDGVCGGGGRLVVSADR